MSFLRVDALHLRVHDHQDLPVKVIGTIGRRADVWELDVGTRLTFEFAGLPIVTIESAHRGENDEEVLLVDFKQEKLAEALIAKLS